MPIFNKDDLQTAARQPEEKPQAPTPSGVKRKPEEVMKQEETYDEVDSGEDEPKVKDNSFKVSVKVVVCGVGIVSLLGLGLMLFIYLGNNKKAVEAQDASRAADANFYDNIPIGLGDIETTPETVGSVGVQYPIGDQTVGASDIVPAPVDVVGVNNSVEGFSDKTAATLRKWGYTNNEMEIAARDGLSAEALVEAAKKERQEAQWEALQAVMDSTSEEYQNLCNQTWLGLPPVDVTGFSNDVTYMQEERTVNVDFEKVESHGMQVWIKCYLKDGGVIFLQVTPMRYNELPDAGNIVISYMTITDGDVSILLNAKEVRVES